MRPTDVAIDTTLSRAIACAEFRFPRAKTMSKQALDLTASLRFALMGIAGSHHILRNLSKMEQVNVYPALRYYGGLVCEHLGQERFSPFAHPVSSECPRFARNLFAHLFDRYLALQKLNGPFDLVLSILVEEFVRDHSKKLGSKILFFRNRAQEKAFDAEAKKSMRFALSFFERCPQDLEEVPEIALIGE